ncbi:uncharacterized protein BXZ73DRAFT_83188 [Epithele typhae]|uniref:uncharacterized protein n=1 Tax=Epithele typhae TaxID=378194 RepID=UPI002007455E|nr:uncharacterized protein BXZ73DRAFT_83188 [Epithele typhae]KAH9910800.1 hypothetical protein BXZ73DRAFT_83188 [Epithele typhae]
MQEQQRGEQKRCGGREVEEWDVAERRDKLTNRSSRPCADASPAPAHVSLYLIICMHSDAQLDARAPIGKIPQELFSLILRWTIQKPGFKSSFSQLFARFRGFRAELPPGFHRWLSLRLVSRHWNETIVSQKHLWSTVIAWGRAHAREWLMLCLSHTDGVPIDVILRLNHQGTSSFLVGILPHAPHLRSLAIYALTTDDRVALNDSFFLSTTFTALTTLIFESGPHDPPTPPVTFEQYNTPALTTISFNAHWQVPRPAVFARLKRISLTFGLRLLPMHVLGLLHTAPQLEEFRVDMYHDHEDRPDWLNDTWYARVGLTEPVTMAHLRILEFKEYIEEQSDTAWVLERLRLPRAQVVHFDCHGEYIFDYLPDTLAESIPFLPSLVGLRVAANRSSFDFEGWTAGETHRFIVDLASWWVTTASHSFVLEALERFVDTIPCPDGPSTLELDGRIVSFITERAEWAGVLRCVPKLTRLSIANTYEHRVDGHLVELVNALRERGKPLAELVFVGEPPLDLEMWRGELGVVGVGSVTRVAGRL